MSIKNFSFAQEDTTTLYDALQGCSAKSLAEVILGQPKTGAANASLDPNALGLATRRITSLLQVLSRLDPNLEASAHVVLPWKRSHLALLSNLSWADALGTRIVLPSGVSHTVRSRFLADVLLCISYV